MANKIIVVGSINVDISIYTANFPRDGETILGQNITLSTGGKGLNQATSALRAGGNVTMIGRIGSDVLAQIPKKHLKNDKFCLDYIYKTNCSTGCADIEVNTQNGENRIIVVEGANAHLSRTDVITAEKEFQDCDYILTQLEVPDQAILAAVELGKKYNKPIILNPAPYREVPDNLFENIDYITPNETEAAFFAKSDSDNVEILANILRSFGIKNVIITMGKSGAYVKTKDLSMQIPTIPQKAVDTTGAGDSFNGALTVALAEGMQIEQAVQFANCAASLSVKKKGAASSMAKRTEIDKMLKAKY